MLNASASEPYAHAKILSVDMEEARKLPGVRCVICGDEYPNRAALLGRRFFMAKPGDTAIHWRAVAGGAAETPRLPRLPAISQVTYDVLPDVTNAWTA